VSGGRKYMVAIEDLDVSEYIFLSALNSIKDEKDIASFIVLIAVPPDTSQLNLGNNLSTNSIITTSQHFKVINILNSYVFNLNWNC
jgi:hypothetical protein